MSDTSGPDLDSEMAADANASRYVLRLYVTGTTARSVRAIANARRICETHLAGRYDLTVIDIYQHPHAARDHQIIAAPTLVRLVPLPLRRLIGDLSDRDRVFDALDIVPAPTPPEMLR